MPSRSNVISSLIVCLSVCDTLPAPIRFHIYYQFKGTLTGPGSDIFSFVETVSSHFDSLVFTVGANNTQILAYEWQLYMSKQQQQQNYNNKARTLKNLSLIALLYTLCLENLCRASPRHA